MSIVNTTARDVDVDLGKLLASLGRDWKRILLVAVAVSLLALVMASIATRKYEAETRLLIETRESVFTRAQGDSDSDRALLDEEGVTSQVEVITSTEILKGVARKFDLASLPEFDEAATPSTFDRILVFGGLKTDPSEVPAEERILTAFREKLNVFRVEKSRVIVINFKSEDPKLAADIPNAIADAYLAESRDAKLSSNADATDWLEPEIRGLAERVKLAEEKVASYRAESDLPLGQNNSALATQQLSELSTELSRVRANRAAAEANAESVRQALQNGGSLDAFPDVLSSELIQRLRERQVQLRADLADLSTTLLDAHPRIRAMKSQLLDLDRQVAAEAQKVLQGLSNASKSANLREQQLVADLNRLKAESSRVGGKEVELRALEREASAQRDLLESYMTRFREAASRRDGNYLPADARIFSRAVMPLEPYFPKIIPIVGAAFAALLLIMGMATLMRELFSGRAMRASYDARVEPVQQIRMPEPTSDLPTTASASLANASARYGEIGAPEAARMLIAGGASRALFISPEGDEAAASAVMVAREVSDAGLRVLLIDLTAMGAASTPMLDGDTAPGITDLLASEADFVDVIHADRYSDCHVIPVGSADPVKAMSAVDRLPIIIETLSTAYDVVIIECGPATADGIRQLVAVGTEVLVSVIEPDADVLAARDDLASHGYEGLTLVTPNDNLYSAAQDRTAA